MAQMNNLVNDSPVTMMDMSEEKGTGVLGAAGNMVLHEQKVSAFTAREKSLDFLPQSSSVVNATDNSFDLAQVVPGKNRGKKTKKSGSAIRPPAVAPSESYNGPAEPDDSMMIEDLSAKLRPFTPPPDSNQVAKSAPKASVAQAAHRSDNAISEI